MQHVFSGKNMKWWRGEFFFFGRLEKSNGFPYTKWRIVFNSIDSMSSCTTVSIGCDPLQRNNETRIGVDPPSHTLVVFKGPRNVCRETNIQYSIDIPWLKWWIQYKKNDHYGCKYARILQVARWQTMRNTSPTSTMATKTGSCHSVILFVSNERYAPNM